MPASHKKKGNTKVLQWDGGPFVLDAASAFSWPAIQYIIPVRSRQRARGFSSFIDNRMAISEDKHGGNELEFDLGKSCTQASRFSYISASFSNEFEKKNSIKTTNLLPSQRNRKWCSSLLAFQGRISMDQDKAVGPDGRR